MLLGRCHSDQEGVVAVKAQEMLTSLSFRKLLSKNQTKHEDSRNSKEIQGFCEHLNFCLIFLKLQALLDFLIKVCWYWLLEYLMISIRFQADN